MDGGKSEVGEGGSKGGEGRSKCASEKQEGGGEWRRMVGRRCIKRAACSRRGQGQGQSSSSSCSDCSSSISSDIRIHRRASVQLGGSARAGSATRWSRAANRLQASAPIDQAESGRAARPDCDWRRFPLGPVSGKTRPSSADEFQDGQREREPESVSVCVCVVAVHLTWPHSTGHDLLFHLAENASTTQHTPTHNRVGRVAAER